MFKIYERSHDVYYYRFGSPTTKEILIKRTANGNTYKYIGDLRGLRSAVQVAVTDQGYETWELIDPATVELPHYKEFKIPKDLMKEYKTIILPIWLGYDAFIVEYIARELGWDILDHGDHLYIYKYKKQKGIMYQVVIYLMKVDHYLIAIGELISDQGDRMVDITKGKMERVRS